MIYAAVAELVYAHDLKSCPARDVGSNPTRGTGHLAQWLEHSVYIRRVGGSNPSVPITLSVTHLQYKNIFLKLK